MTANFYLTDATIEVHPGDDFTVLYLVEYDGSGRVALVVSSQSAQALLAIAAVLRATAEQYGATVTGEDERAEVSDARGMGCS